MVKPLVYVFAQVLVVQYHLPQGIPALFVVVRKRLAVVRKVFVAQGQIPFPVVSKQVFPQFFRYRVNQLLFRNGMHRLIILGKSK